MMYHKHSKWNIIFRYILVIQENLLISPFIYIYIITKQKQQKNNNKAISLRNIWFFFIIKEKFIDELKNKYNR